jgi:hypothetical protein
MILNLRWSLTRYEEPGRNNGAGFDPTSLGCSKSFVSQLRKPSFPRISGIAGDFGVDNAGSYNMNTYNSWGAVLTQIHGKHSLRYGAEYWVLQQANAGWAADPESDRMSPHSCSACRTGAASTTTPTPSIRSAL